MLYSNGRLLPANVDFDRGLRSGLDGVAEGRVTLFEEFFDAPRFQGPLHAETLATFLSRKYATRAPDVVVVAGGEALEFVLAHRARVFPGAPVVHAGVDAHELAQLSAIPPDVVGVPVATDFASTVRHALRWHPHARQLVIVTGAGILDRRWEASLRAGLAEFDGLVATAWLGGLPTRGTVPRRLSGLGRTSVVLSPGYFEDGAGRLFFPRDAVEAMARASSAPFTGSFLTHIGTGAVGGCVMDPALEARQGAEIVNRLLAGQRAADSNCRPRRRACCTSIGARWSAGESTGARSPLRRSSTSGSRRSTRPTGRKCWWPPECSCCRPG